MIAPAIPIAVGVGAVGLIGLRLRAMSKAKAAANLTAAKQSLPAGPQPAAPNRASAPAAPHIDPSLPFPVIAAQLGIPPNGNPQPPGTRAPTLDELIDSLRDPAHFAQNHPGVSQDQVSPEMLQAALDAMNAQNAGKIAVPGVPAAAVNGQQAIVTTNDPAPSGDLIIRAAASAGAAQIGGAEKNGTVTILDSSDPTFARIQWDGGSRLPAATGFARKAFLKLI